MAIDDGFPVVGCCIVVRDIFELKGEGVFAAGTAEGLIRKGDQVVSYSPLTIWVII